MTIIGLSGYAQSGKDTAAGFLLERGFERIAFADKLKAFALDAGGPWLRSRVETDGWEEAKKSEGVRTMLQRIGVAARLHFGEDFWVDQALGAIKPGGLYVVTDVRFPNEADAIKSLGGQVVRIVRPGVGAVNGHVSESALDSYDFDRIIVNDGDLSNLRSLALGLVA